MTNKSTTLNPLLRVEHQQVIEPRIPRFDLAIKRHELKSVCSRNVQQRGVRRLSVSDHSRHKLIEPVVRHRRHHFEKLMGIVIGHSSKQLNRLGCGHRFLNDARIHREPNKSRLCQKTSCPAFIDSTRKPILRHGMVRVAFPSQRQQDIHIRQRGQQPSSSISSRITAGSITDFSPAREITGRPLRYDSTSPFLASPSANSSRPPRPSTSCVASIVASSGTTDTSISDFRNLKTHCSNNPITVHSLHSRGAPRLDQCRPSRQQHGTSASRCDTSFALCLSTKLRYAAPQRQNVPTFRHSLPRRLLPDGKVRLQSIRMPLADRSRS